MNKLRFFFSVLVLVFACPAVSLSAEASYLINAPASYSYVNGSSMITGWVCDAINCDATDDGYFDLSLGDFNFQFYGVPVSTLKISTNGYMTFGTEGTEWSNFPIPFTPLPNAIIAPFWTDLDLTGLTGERGVWWGMNGAAPNRELIVEWRQVPTYDFGTETYSFEAILYESTNRIKFQYLDVDSGTDYDFGMGSTVGVENFDGTAGSQYSYNTALLSNGLAVEFVPSTIIFSDVPSGYWAEGYIVAIYNDGITQGCNPNLYCPSGIVTRDQMASFIVRAMDGADATTCLGTLFSDVPFGTPHCANIERLSALNITQGCGGGNYCPQGNVTRAEMASFLVRAVDGTNATTCSGTLFGDVPLGAPHCANIERLSALNITQGCTQGMYCPSNNVLRDQMAAFLARAFLQMQ